MQVGKGKSNKVEKQRQEIKEGRAGSGGMPWVKLLLVIPANHTGAGSSSGTLLPIPFPANAPGTAEEDGQSMWVPSTHMADPDGVPSF